VRRLACTLLAAALALLAPAAARAEAAPPWRAAERMQDLVFEAQSALLLDEPQSAAGLVARARAGQRGPLDRGLRRDAPEADRAARSALAAAARAARARDETGVAAARGRLRAALFRGSYAVTLAAVRHGEARRAASWLLLRDFRRATRFTRPGVDATVAVRDLARRRSGPRKAALGVRKDLLDTYQARLADHLEDADDAARRGFRARWAQTAALAVGLWAILAPEYEHSRGGAARREADAAFDRLERAAVRGDARRYARARAELKRALDGFTAAPFTAQEQARRAGQLLRFIDLVPVEYDHGTDDGHVTVPFEIQEAIGFREGASSAFSDLEGELERRDPRAVALVSATCARTRRTPATAGASSPRTRSRPRRSTLTRPSTGSSPTSGRRTTPSPTSTSSR
jgi:high-affinity iron transporter